jgi:hypothetical protein
MCWGHVLQLYLFILVEFVEHMAARSKDGRLGGMDSLIDEVLNAPFLNLDEVLTGGLLPGPEVHPTVRLGHALLAALEVGEDSVVDVFDEDWVEAKDEGKKLPAFGRAQVEGLHGALEQHVLQSVTGTVLKVEQEEGLAQRKDALHISLQQHVRKLLGATNRYLLVKSNYQARGRFDGLDDQIWHQRRDQQLSALAFRSPPLLAKSSHKVL